MLDNSKQDFLVSVVIPFYSNVTWLEEAVDSVLRQTYSNWEIIIVNDGSKEDVGAFLSKYKSRITYIYQDNKGPGAARNNAIKHSNGDLIAFLDSDDVWLPRKLEIQVEFMKNNPMCMWSHCGYETFGDCIPKQIKSTEMTGMMYPKCLSTCRIATPCIIVRKSAFDDPVIRFNETMRYGQDFYLWILLCKKYELGYINEVYCKVRMRENNAAKRAYVMIKAKSELWRNLDNVKWINKNEVPFRIRSAYRLCDWEFKAISKINRLVKGEKAIEFISKILYVIPYCFLKLSLDNRRRT